MILACTVAFGKWWIMKLESCKFEKEIVGSNQGKSNCLFPRVKGCVFVLQLRGSVAQSVEPVVCMVHTRNIDDFELLESH